MRIRCRHILPVIGLTLFGAVSYRNIVFNHMVHRHPNKYFYWSDLSLDTDPLNRRPELERPCEESEEDSNCIGWDPLDMWIDPGWLARASVISGLPAIALSIVILMGLGKLGVSQLVSFMIWAPLLLFAWYYFLGWMIDRGVARLHRNSA